MFLFTHAFRIILTSPPIRFCLKTHYWTIFEAFLLLAQPKKIGNDVSVFKRPLSRRVYKDRLKSLHFQVNTFESLRLYFNRMLSFACVRKNETLQSYKNPCSFKTFNLKISLICMKRNMQGKQCFPMKIRFQLGNSLQSVFTRGILVFPNNRKVLHFLH